LTPRELVAQYRAALASGRTLEPDDPTLAFALRSMAILDEGRARDATSASLVATSPRSTVSARRVATVVDDLIAESTRELVVVGYELSDPDVINKIAGRAASGVDVHLILDRVQSAAVFDRQTWPRFAPFPRYWTTAAGPGGRRISLHSKALISDQTRALVGSANLTFSGLRRNLELGVLLQGRMVRELRDYLGELIDRRVLVSDDQP
jgi:phosphatidylserine/phosphatidylglycerophosphate/cardiolipin synthase-like enzyme